MRYTHGQFSTFAQALVNSPGTAAQLTVYMDAELRRIEQALRLPSVDALHMQKLGATPSRYEDGDLFYFLAGVVGTNEGFYGREAGGWVKL